MEAEKGRDGWEKVPASVGDMQGSARLNVNPNKDDIFNYFFFIMQWYIQSRATTVTVRNLKRLQHLVAPVWKFITKFVPLVTYGTRLHH